MATEETIVVHPGDIIQATQPGPLHGHFLLVTEVHARHIGAIMRWPETTTVLGQEAYHRLKPGAFAIAGVAPIMPPEILAARRDSVATARDLARVADPDDMTPRWDVEIRFNGRTTGSGQKHNEQVRADCVEQALEVVRVPVMEHGGSVCIVGVTVDEVKA